MPILPPETWVEIRKAYLETAEPIRQIAARYGISHSTISNRALREDWPDPPAGRVRVGAAAGGAHSQAGTARDGEAHRAARAGRRRGADKAHARHRRSATRPNGE